MTRGKLVAAIALAASVTAAPLPILAAECSWSASWAASPLAPPGPPFRDPPSLSNQTVTQAIVLSGGGDSVRIRLSNEFGSTPLEIGASSILIAGSRQALTFAGAKAVTIPPGAPMLSDPVRASVPDGARLEIALYFPKETTITTFHPLGLDASFVSGPGDMTLADSGARTPFEAVMLPGVDTNNNVRPFLSEVDVCGAAAETIVTLGDSITDGAGSSPGQSHRWPDVLARRLAAAHKPVALANEGIGGNRLLADGAGKSVLARLDRDALSVPGAKAIILMIGINDIGFSGGFIPIGPPDIIAPAELIAGYKQVIARAHAKGIKIIGATMTPFEGSPTYQPAKEAVRQAANAWIRTGGAFDAVIDFDALLRDPKKPSLLAGRFDSGDHIHPNDAGYQTMGEAVDLSMP